MKLIVDMNLSPRWVDVLSEARFEAVHWSSVGPPDAPDSTIMSYAAAMDAIVLTHDLDFGAILAASGAATPSVVQIRADDISPGSIGDQIIRALHQMAEELRGHDPQCGGGFWGWRSWGRIEVMSPEFRSTSGRRKTIIFPRLKARATSSPRREK